VTAAKFISDLVAKGRYCFSAEEAAGTLGTSAIATRAALRRLRQKGEVAMPYKGFYIIVPPEFRNIGCLPAGHFIPSLMAHLKEKYYAGLLSAEYHGAAHQRPQVFQVVVARNKPESIDGEELVRLAELSPIAWSQRLGYLLDMVGAQKKTGELAKHITERKPVPTPLAPSLPFEGISRLKPWHIPVNTRVEAEV
jgi:hypothetical protein